MPGPVRSNHLPAFDSIASEDNDFRCIYSLERERFRRCGCKVNKPDRLIAASLKQDILNSQNDALRDTLLVEYARLCCCVANHRSTLISNNVLLGEICRRWASEIDLSNSNGPIFRIPQTPPFSPTAAIRNQPRSTHSFSDVPSRDPTPPAPDLVDGRTQRRILRSARKESLATNPDPSLPHFKSYLTKPDLSLSKAILRPLLPSETADGTVYLFTRPSAPGLVKIGYTANQPSERLKSWQTKCQYVPRLEFVTSKIPNAKRVEFLVQNELWKERRRQQDCTCGTKHIEWFEIEIPRASAVIRKWATWMQEQSPYDEAGELKTKWRETIADLDQSKVFPTGEVLSKAMTENPTEEEQRLSQECARDKRKERRSFPQRDETTTIRRQSESRQSTPTPSRPPASTVIRTFIDRVGSISPPNPQLAATSRDSTPVTFDPRTAELLETLTKALLDLHALVNAQQDLGINRSGDLALRSAPVFQSTFMALRSHDLLG